MTRKVGQNYLVLLCDHGSLVGLRTQDYKSLCAAVTICATLVNAQAYRHGHADTDRKHFDQLIRAVQPAKLKRICVKIQRRRYGRITEKSSGFTGVMG